MYNIFHLDFKINISYSSKDQQYHEWLKTHLNPYCNRESIEITRSSSYLGKINKYSVLNSIKNATINIVLLSKNYFNNCAVDIELLNKNSEDLVILPIIIESCFLGNTFFEKLETIEIDKYKTKDEAFTELIREINKIFEEEKCLIKETDFENIVLEFVSAGYPEEYLNEVGKIKKITPEDITGKLNTDEKFFEIKGSSMEPRYYEGQTLKCKRVTDSFLTDNIDLKMQYLKNLIKKNTAYIVETREKGMVLKELELDIENKLLNLISCNPDYPLEQISIEVVFSIWKIKSKITVEHEY